MTKSINVNSETARAGAASRGTKKEQLIKLLRTKDGADIKALSDKLGWQQHTTRAALTGLRKAGFQIAGEKPEKGGMSRYRILAAPAATGSATDAG